jgi:hypothetical protein
MRLLALLLPLVVLCSCDAALDSAAHVSAAPPPTANVDGSEPVLIESRPFKYNESYDWNFRIEGVNPREGVPISFRTHASTFQRDEVSRISMTPLLTGEYAFASAWDGYDHPNAWVYPVVLDPESPDGLRVQRRFAALGEDEDPTTPTPPKSYHNTPRGLVIDYVDIDDGSAAQPTSVTVPGRREPIENVAYLVYVPKGDRSGPWQQDISVDVYGPPGTRVITESVGDGQLPQTVQELLLTTK